MGFVCACAFVCVCCAEDCVVPNARRGRCRVRGRRGRRGDAEPGVCPCEGLVCGRRRTGGCGAGVTVEEEEGVGFAVDAEDEAEEDPDPEPEPEG
ncbi:hypothetical protein B0H13DRAFT_2053419, partial [Mycena leptocephala]